MEIVVRRDAFRSGFEVILFAPGLREKGGQRRGAVGEDPFRKSGAPRSLRSETRHVTRE